ncbi:SpoIVB peptidase [Anaeromicropila herbilytica]|uniref:SpoIVB peptidase n=1 Tax=Anaeromicropila herbilytica TaxID=2785025 RepID=A0A7R7EKI3_9FIRM|nr:SpoIVB peptidase [Anaeromicropila herbilytica]BCN30419.1 SpoIVB peptidase [Anaeromicropila herbilytica]
MNRKSWYRKFLIVMLLINITAILYLSYKDLDSKIPNNIKIIAGNEQKFNLDLPVEGDINSKDVSVINIRQQKIPDNKIHINFDEPFSLRSSEIGEYNINLKLFGLLNFKQIKLDVIKPIKLVPSGMPIGIYVETNGIMVLGTSSIQSRDGLNYEPALNILKSGDYIVGANNTQIHYKEELIKIIQKSKGKDILLKVRRNKEIIKLKIKPIETPTGEYKIGTWIRDNTQGIGTLTFLDPDGAFGALGHGITDVDTSLLMDINDGAIYTADIMSIVKGKSGQPGEIVGLINKNEEDKIGDIKINTNQGIFGKVNQLYHFDDNKKMEIGLKQDIKIGPATILCQVEDSIKEYNIEIVKVELNNQNLSKGMIIKITDKRLLRVTNGIVQGMSGSPIIQDGKLIGAVTHVFIQDSTKGYGTFIENMIKTYDK